MKKSSKGFILISAAAIAMGISGLSRITVPMAEKAEKEIIRAYNHNPNNILDNVFLNGDDIILPFIFDDADTTITSETVKEEFRKKGLTVKNISLHEKGEIIGTGTKITVEENDNVYNVIVYGDVDGDGIVDLIDAQNIILHYLEEKSLTGFYAESAKVSERSDEINLIDAQRVILFYLGNPLEPDRLVVDEPDANNKAPVITLKGNSNDMVKYGTTYTDPWVTVTDANDKNVKLTTSGEIKTNILGEQSITYTAKNFSGAEASITRKVTVVDYLEKIEVTQLPTKQEYIIGDLLEKEGGKVTVTTASGNTIELDMTDSRVTVSNYKMNGEVTVSYSEADPITKQTITKTDTFKVTVKRPPVSEINIETDKTTGDLHSEFQFKLTSGVDSKGIPEEDIPLEKIKWTVTKNGSTVTSGMYTTTQINSNDFKLVEIKPETQADGTVAALIKFKAFTVGNYKVTITLDGYSNSIKGEENLSITRSYTVSEIAIDESNTVLGAENNGVRILNKSGLIPIEFKHKYPDGEFAEDLLEIARKQITVQVKSNGQNVTWAYPQLYTNLGIATENDNTGVIGIRLNAIKSGTVELSITASGITKKHTIKIEGDAVIPLLEDDGKQTITFYSTAKPTTNELVKTINGENYTLLPIVRTNGTRLKVTDINNEDDTAVNDGTLTIIAKDASGKELPKANSRKIRLFGTDKSLLGPNGKNGVNWEEQDGEVGYIGIYANSNVKTITLSYLGIQEVNVIVHPEVSKITVTSADASDKNPYGVFTVTLTSAGQEVIPMQNLQWQLKDSSNKVVASGTANTQTSGYVGSADGIRVENDYIKLTQNAIYGSQGANGMGITMGFKVLKAGQYKMVFSLEEYASSVSGEIDVIVSEINTISGFKLDKNNTVLQKVAGKVGEYNLQTNAIIPITYIREYQDEELNKKIEEEVTDMEVLAEKWTVNLTDSTSKKLTSQKLYYADGYEAGDGQGVHYIKLNVNKAGTVNLTLTLNGNITEKYKINVADTAIVPVLEAGVSTISFYEEENEFTKAGEDGTIYTLIPIYYTNGTRLKVTDVNNEGDDTAITDGIVTIVAKDGDEKELPKATSYKIRLFGTDKDKSLLGPSGENEDEWEEYDGDVGYIGIYGIDTVKTITILCDGMEPINIDVVPAQ